LILVTLEEKLTFDLSLKTLDLFILLLVCKLDFNELCLSIFKVQQLVFKVPFQLFEYLLQLLVLTLACRDNVLSRSKFLIYFFVVPHKGLKLVR